MSAFELDEETILKMAEQFQVLLDKEYGNGKKNAMEILVSYSPVVSAIIEDSSEMFNENPLVRVCYIRDAILFSSFSAAITSGIVDLGAGQVTKVMLLHASLMELLKIAWLLGYIGSRGNSVDDFEDIMQIIGLERKAEDSGPTDEELKSLWGYGDE